MKIKTVEDFASIRSTSAPYGLYGVTKDGGCLCDACLRSEAARIRDSIAERCDDGWLVVVVEGADVDPGTSCDHCGKDISAYAENP